MEARQTSATCKSCGASLGEPFVDLGMHPLCESFIAPEQENAMEPFYPLRVHVCPQCFLVQLQEYVSPSDIFSDYAYFSSYSSSWLDHMRHYAEEIASELHLGPQSLVVEAGSNDGYLLRNFVRLGIPCLGVDPAENVARVAIEHGVPTRVGFFGEALASELVAEGRHADLICGANVLAQVPDVNDFVAGIATLLAPGGTATIEFPHLLRLMEEAQFDTIYHEHFYYFSIVALTPLVERHGLRVVDVRPLPTHGGSLRVYLRPADDARPVAPSVERVLREERAAGLDDLATFGDFGEAVAETKRALLECLIEIKRQGKSVAAYGAPGKGNTLLNYCGIGRDFIDFAVDRNEHKWGRFTPGSHIPIHPPEHLLATKPDYVLILPWNLREEIIAQQQAIRSWGGRFVVPIPAPPAIL